MIGTKYHQSFTKYTPPIKTAWACCALATYTHTGAYLAKPAHPEFYKELLATASATMCTERKCFEASLKPKQAKKNTRGDCEFLYHKELTATR